MARGPFVKVDPQRPDAVVKTVEFVKGPDRSVPIAMVATVETP